MLDDTRLLPPSGLPVSEDALRYLRRYEPRIIPDTTAAALDLLLGGEAIATCAFEGAALALALAPATCGALAIAAALRTLASDRIARAGRYGHATPLAG